MRATRIVLCLIVILTALVPGYSISAEEPRETCFHRGRGDSSGLESALRMHLQLMQQQLATQQAQLATQKEIALMLREASTRQQIAAAAAYNVPAPTAPYNVPAPTAPYFVPAPTAPYQVPGPSAPYNPPAPSSPYTVPAPGVSPNGPPAPSTGGAAAPYTVPQPGTSTLTPVPAPTSYKRQSWAAARR